MRKRRSNLRDLAEYALARASHGLLRLFPVRLTAWLARRLAGPCAYLLLAGRRRCGRENLRRALPGSIDEIKPGLLLRRVFANLALVAVEFFLYPRWVRGAAPWWEVSPESQTVLDNLQLRVGGIIFVTAHLGNWELLGAVGHALGLPVHSVARRLDNRLLDRWIDAQRREIGHAILTKHGCISAMIGLLQSGANTAQLVDQRAGRHGIAVDFFGLPASTTRAPALLALRTGCPIVPVCMVRQGGNFRFKIHFGEPIYPKPGATIVDETRRMTQCYTVALERWIGRYPDQWLWLHRRWKTPPHSVRHPGKRGLGDNESGRLFDAVHSQ